MPCILAITTNHCTFLHMRRRYILHKQNLEIRLLPASYRTRRRRLGSFCFYRPLLRLQGMNHFYLFSLQEILEFIIKLTKKTNRRFSVFRQPGSPAASAARDRLHKRTSCLPVHGIDELPRMPVRHGHGSGRFRNGAVFSYPFQENDPAIS